eukprot:CAMPEP_0185728630 /NCGR_PEP_ID=MMETSP1171-20130828/3963_1 /TAXON_ID=374046 /ORGANISM="Helicotheca tamensis, Strain CCMP826" /LENGTH=254 /DNA_ID=CAMNT_0028397357 /DNA_START=64 /DNA_END=828 /DNA_ORIENTATION=-
MKIIAASTVFLITLPSSVVGFVSPSCNSPSKFGVRRFMSATVESSALEIVESGSSTSSDKSIYEKIGFKEDDIAMGLDPEEILEFMGNRDDIVKKFKEDNKSFDDARVELEVNKFMMDYENCMRWITYGKKIKYEAAKPKIEEPPTPSGADLKQQAADNFADPSVFATYAAWIGGGAGFALFKNQIAEPKFASGEWSDIHLNIGDWLTNLAGPGADVVTPAIGQADSVISSTVPVEAVQSTVEAVAGTVNDVLN